MELLLEKDPSSKCRRETNGYNISNKEKYMKLLSYCLNRDYIKSLCESNRSFSINVSPVWYAFYVFTEENYETFYEEYKCIDYSVEPKEYSYHISDDCTLYDMAKTFPKINVQDKIILYGDKSRKAIEQCKNNAKIGDGDALLSNDPVPLVDGQGRLPDAQEILHDGQAALVRDETGSEDSRSDFIQIASLSQTELTSNENGPSKPIYYAGLSTLGVVFTSTVLYKYTALGPLIRSLVSKKEKLRQTTNKHLAQQWLERTSEYMDSNSENSHYNFPYQSMQN
ncbi:unnamed protein product [Plasmodium vivax]|uniref:(malaria parasite P. vivax) hypothetical protein n=1 Tax=Plasmodium vivax TaxID=5855 RepID=A0A8S4H865_PLAVI|nr:unnamed protein product [Plasmodium vivax]